MTIYPLQPGEMHCIKIESGEDILTTLQIGIDSLNITHGVILNGIGSVSAYRLHVIKTTEIPPGNTFFSGSGPYDVDCMNGFVIGGKVHAHIAISNDSGTIGGHLEEGTIAHTFCVITVLNTSASALDGLDHFKGKKL